MRKIVDDFLPCLPAGLAGLALLFVPLFSREWPLGDGGLFYVFTRDLLANDFRLPQNVIFNGQPLPFAYPPLGFYIAAGIAKWSQGPLLDIFRWLPAVFTWCQIPLFYLITREIFKSNEFRMGSTLLFAVDHSRYSWLIMGGGLTRALGYTLALAGAWFAVRFLFSGRRRDWFIASLLGGLVLMAHIGIGFAYGWFLVSILLIAYGRHAWFQRRAPWLFHLTLLGGGVLLMLAVSAPWWGTVLLHHGLTPFEQAFKAGVGSWHKVVWVFFPFLPYTPLKSYSWIAIFAWMGLFASRYSSSQRWLMFGYVVFFFLVAPRSAVRLSSPFLAWLAYMGIERLIHARQRWERLLAYAMVYLAIFVVAAGETLTLPGLQGLEILQLQTLDQRLPAQAKILVLPPASWGAEWEKEWLPAVTDLQAALLVQGSEWNGQFYARVQAQEMFRIGWEQKGVQAVEEAFETWPRFADYIWVLPGHPLVCEALRGQDFLEPLSWSWDQGCLFQYYDSEN